MQTAQRLIKEFNPGRFVDRELEQTLFEELLLFQDAGRMLAVRDASGMGKSHLLDKFQHRCRTTRPKIAVCQLDFKQLPDQTPLVITRQIVKSLKALDVPFPAFTRADSARASGDFRSIRSLLDRMPRMAPTAARNTPRRDSFARYEQGIKVLRARVGREHPRLLELLTFEQRLQEHIGLFRHEGDTETRRAERHGIIARLNEFAFTELGTTFNDLCPSDDPLFDPFDRMPMPADAPGPLTDEQEHFAQEACLEAFGDDLRSYCADTPLVLLIDSYERCNDQTRQWMHNHFLEHYCFDQQKRPHHLLLVLAGQTVPPFEALLSEEDERAIVRSVQLGRWSREHVEQFLQVHDCHYDERVIDAVHCLIEQDIPLSQVAQVVEMMSLKRREG